MLTLALLIITHTHIPKFWQNSSIWTLKPIYPLTVTGIYVHSGSIICLSSDCFLFLFLFLCAINCLVFPEKSTRKANWVLQTSTRGQNSSRFWEKGHAPSIIFYVVSVEWVIILQNSTFTGYSSLPRTWIHQSGYQSFSSSHSHFS